MKTRGVNLRIRMVLGGGLIINGGVKGQELGYGINYTGALPNINAALDIDITGAPNRLGILIPRMALSSATDQTGFPSTPLPTSLLVYNTGTGGLTPAGFYYWDGTQWRRFLTNANYPAFNCANSNTVLKRDLSGNIACTIIKDSNNQVYINMPTPLYTMDVFSVNASGTNDAINGYAASGIAVYARSTSGYGVYSISNATTGSLAGVYGRSASSGGYGVFGINTNSSGTGIVGVGNNLGTFYILTGGSGGTFNGANIGVFGKATANTGTVGGGFFSAGTTGTSPYAYVALINGNTSAGGYFNAGGTNQYAYVAYNSGGTLYKIYGQGTVATIVRDLNNNYVVMNCPEAPEVLFMDYGEGQLVNGRAYVKLDPIFAKNIVVNEKHPLRVFVQPKGKCKGLYVTNESQEGFEVIELDDGTSNVKFTWMVVANRADEYDEQGNLISKYADNRFEPAPPPLPMLPVKAVEVNKEKREK